MNRKNYDLKNRKPKTWEEFVEKHRDFFEKLAKTSHKKKDQHN